MMLQIRVGMWGSKWGKQRWGSKEGIQFLVLDDHW